ncbi:MAG TPA: glycosyltransferase family 2 protein [Polyangiales bacterium]|nr:glycosyltransferase family 2 protein [Polyangiales bacterium]
MQGLSSQTESRLGERLSTPMRPVALDQARVFIVVAAYNEAASIGDLVRDLMEQYAHVVVVDDGSTDETAELAAEAGACVLTHLINRGQGAALQTGIAYALSRAADYVVTLDVDGQYDVKDIALLLSPISDGRVHATLGCRAPSEHDKASLGLRMRRVLHTLKKLGTRLGLPPAVPDAHNGLCAFSRHAAQMIDLKLDRMTHGSEIVQQILAGGLKMQEVPVRVRVSDYALRKRERSSAALRVAIRYIMARFTR